MSAPGQRRRPVDMSLPPELRGRKRATRQVGKGAGGQMDHASNGKSRKKAREGEQKIRRDRETG